MSSNRLPMLAAEIRDAHDGILAAAKTAAERAIAAGKALIEAKALLKHGEWLPWLKDHCRLPERTAQLYMRIASLGLESATVADLGLKAAAKVLGVIRTPNYNPFAHCDENDRRAWHLFILFLVRVAGYQLDGAAQHVEWLLQRPFQNPDEWLGEEGAAFRRRCGMREMEERAAPEWRAFVALHSGTTIAEIEAELDALAQTSGHASW